MSRLDANTTRLEPLDEQPVRTVTLAAQIEEVDYELKQRDKVYANLDRKDPSRARERQMHVERMQAVRRTLEWLRGNEHIIRAVHDAKLLEEQGTVELLKAAAHALRSYEHGNSGPDLAKDVAQKIELLLEEPNAAEEGAPA